MVSSDTTTDFLPVCLEDMEKRGWSGLDFVFVTGDAYVDHPAFCAAVISRVLVSRGYRVGVIAQPDCSSTKDFARLGTPKLGFLVAAGNMDSMLNAYTAAKKRRSSDAYSPGGKINLRPLRATIVYTKRLKEIFPDIPVIIGGIEASLRRMAHYDYWSNTVMPSILIDSGADMLVYGMGERAMIEIAGELHRGVTLSALTDIKGTCFVVPNRDYVYDYVELPSYKAVKSDKGAFAEAVKLAFLEQDPVCGKRLIQEHDKSLLVVNPPSMPLDEAEMDAIYDLPYMRRCHPVYDKYAKGDAPPVPALQEVEFSLIGQRGCFGGCNFCAIVFHEGRIISRRSHESLLKEAKILTEAKNFKGYIHDVGGPTANFREKSCQGQTERGLCKNKSCLSPAPCRNLQASHRDYIELLKKIRNLPKVKKVFVRSGIRFDYILADRDGDKFIRELCEHHVSGQMKIAPEHISDNVTRLMGKSDKKTLLKFVDRFTAINKQLNKKQYLVPYFMSSHPGATLKDALGLAEFLHKMHWHPRQVQDFIPTPGTISTAMYHTGINPLTGEKVYVAKSPEEKAMQRALLQYFLPQNRTLVIKALKKLGREDLIGYEKKCLIKPTEKSKGKGGK